MGTSSQAGLDLQRVLEGWSQCWSDSPQRLSQNRQAPSGREDAEVQGHGVAAEKQLLSTLAVPILFSCSNSSSFFLAFSSWSLSQLSYHRALTTLLLEFFFSQLLCQLFPRIAA